MRSEPAVRTSLVLAAGICAAALLISGGSAVASSVGMGRIEWPEVIDRFVWWLSWCLMLPAVVFLTRRVSHSHRSANETLRRTVAGAAVLFVAVEILRLLCRVAARLPFLPAGTALRSVADFHSIVFGDLSIGVMFVATLASIVFQTRAAIAAAETADAERAMLSSRVMFLSEQMKPHFVFNALNGVVALMHDNAPAAKKLLERLADFIEASFGKDLKKLTSVADEISTARGYADIQVQRFEGLLEVTFDVPEELSGCAVPTFLLQPLIENAIKHGLAGKLPGVVTIQLARTDHHLLIRVEDSGRGYPTSMIEGLGIGNTRHRLEMLFPGTARFSMGRGARGGATVLVEIPAIPVD